jgi:hypothetical protein
MPRRSRMPAAEPDRLARDRVTLVDDDRIRLHESRYSSGYVEIGYAHRLQPLLGPHSPEWQCCVVVWTHRDTPWWWTSLSGARAKQRSRKRAEAAALEETRRCLARHEQDVARLRPGAAPTTPAEVRAT